MSSGGSVTHWIADLKAGDKAAAQKLWERYFARLVRLARKKLKGMPGRAADEEDVTLSAFKSFWLGVVHGRFPQVHDRDDLWRLLVTITARKAVDEVEHELRQRRGAGRVEGESAFAQPGPRRAEGGIEQIVGPEPTPEFAAQVAEEYERLLDILGDETLREVAIWKMQGYTKDEIAERLGCARRTVARKLETIRIIWRQMSPR